MINKPVLISQKRKILQQKLHEKIKLLIKIQNGYQFYSTPKMADQSQQPCVMCHQVNEQMLMLSCVHDPCVNCAAVHYVQNQPSNSRLYTCAKCGQETELDQSSVDQLKRVYNFQKNKKKSRNPPSTVTQKESKTKTNQRAPNYTRAKQLNQNPSISKTQNPNPISQPSKTSNGSKYQPTYPCNDHQDEQLTYYCFTCNKPICPECAIHGLHKDHEVLTTRKAIMQIKDLLLEDRKKLDAEVFTLGSTRDSAKKLSRQWVDENKRDQEYIKRKLAQLKTIITQKEKQLIKSTQVNLQRNVQILRSESIASDKALNNLMGVSKVIDSTLKKDQLAILQEFNKRDEQTDMVIQMAESEKDKLREQQIKNPLKALELDLFEQAMDKIINQIQNLKISAAPLKP